MKIILLLLLLAFCMVALFCVLLFEGKITKFLLWFIPKIIDRLTGLVNRISKQG